MSLIVFEGVDGGGKSSQLKEIERLLKHSGWNVSSMAFPTPEFRHWRSLLFENNPPTPAELIHLHLLDFIRHLPVSPAPDHILLLDRYYPSTAVYQSTPEIPPQTVLGMAASMNLPSPDLCILFMPPENDILPRLKPEDYHLFENGRWHEMRQEYFRLASTDPSGWTIIDTSLSFEKVTTQLMTIIENHLRSQGFRPALISSSPPSQLSPLPNLSGQA